MVMEFFLGQLESGYHGSSINPLGRLSDDGMKRSFMYSKEYTPAYDGKYGNEKVQNNDLVLSVCEM